MESKQELFSSPQLHKRNHRKIIDVIGNTYSTSSYKFTANPQLQNKEYLRSKRLDERSVNNHNRNPSFFADDYHSVDQLNNSRIKSQTYVKLPLLKSRKYIFPRMSPYEKLNSRHQVYLQPTVSLVTNSKSKTKVKQKKDQYKRICSVNCLQHGKKKQKKAKNIAIPAIRQYLIEQNQAKHPQTQLNRYLSKMKAKQQEANHNKYLYQTFFGLQPQFYKLQTEYSKHINDHFKSVPFINSKKVRQSIPSIPQKEDLPIFIQQYRPCNKQINMERFLRNQRFIIQYSSTQLYFGQMTGNKKEGFGILIQDKKVFQGFFRNNYKVKGVQINSSGIYKGQFFNEKRDGDGQFEWLNGQYYIGQWCQGNRHGRGIWTNKYGESYNGQWVLGKGEGYGVYLVDGQQYKGNFIDFKKYGYGRQKFINGDIYQGQFSQGYPSGKGKYTWSNGTKYQGQFITGLRNGKGILKTLDGFCYIGQFLDERPEGLCEIFMPNGDKYHGYLRDGKKNGRGTLFLKDLQKVFDGYWQDDNFIRHFTL